MNDFRNILKEQRREFDHPEIEYQALLAEHYNKDPLSAFPMLVTLRDELEQFLENRKFEIDCDLKEIMSLANRHLNADPSSSFEDCMDKIENALNEQVRNPQPDLYDTVNDLVAKFERIDSSSKVWFLDQARVLIDTFVTDTKDYRNTLILRNTAFKVVNTILRFSFPLKLELDKNLIHTDAYIEEILTEKPHKVEIYTWYGEIKHGGKKVVEAFYELQDLLKEKDLDMSDYFTTETPENFDSAYRSYLKKRKLNSDKKGK